MNLANPSALLWAALAIPIVIFYILKIRQRRVPVSTTLFWRQIFEEKQPRSLWEYLRHLLSLLVQVALLALLVFALAEPFFRWELFEARRVVLILDNSASMNAADGSPTRLARAKEEGRRIIDGLRFRDEMAIVAAGTQPQVRCGLTGHQRSLRTALDAIGPTDGPTRVKDAIELARRLLAGKKNHTILLLTDGCFPGAAELVKADDVAAVGVGKPTGNVGISQFQVRRSLVDPIGYEVLAEVVNQSDEPVECRLELELDGDVVDVVPLKLEPGKPWTRVFEKTSARGGRLSARLNRPDALPADNQAWALLPRRDVRPVTLITDGNLFLEKVFQAIPLVKLTTTPEPARMTGSFLTVLDRKIPTRLPSGPLLVIDPAGSCDLWDLGEKLQNPIVTKQDKDSPLLAHVRLDNVLMPEARQLKPKAKAQVLVTAVSGDSLLCAFDRPAGKVLVLTVDLDKSDLPLQTAFPILVTNAMNWFAGNQGELRESLASGAVTEVELPSRPAEGLVVRAPHGETRPLPENAARLALGPLDQCGVWTVMMSDSKSQPKKGSTNSGQGAAPLLEVACNLASRQESDLRPPRDLAWRPGAIAAGYGGRPIWFYLIALAWALAGLEWFLYQRRWIS